MHNDVQIESKTKMKKKLSICIPTFNRPEKLQAQLDFICADLGKISDSQNLKEIEVIIRDNNSPRFDPAAIRLEFPPLVDVKLHHNDENVGLVGNLIKLTDDCEGAYIWFIGDDDRLHSGIIGCVINEIKSNPSFLMLNHEAKDVRGKIQMSSALPEKKINDIIDVFDHSRTTMMFITACIYRRSILQKAIGLFENTSLSAPLFWSFFAAADGKDKYVRQIYITNIWGDTSWASHAKTVFGTLVPKELERVSYLYRHKAFKFKCAVLKYHLKLKSDLVKRVLLKLKSMAST